MTMLRFGFIVTNLSRPTERVVAFYNHRRKVKLYIKEGKCAIKWARLLFVSSLISAQKQTGMTTKRYLSTVRRHINWNNQRPELKEDLAHLVQDIKRRICGIASAGFPSSFA